MVSDRWMAFSLDSFAFWQPCKPAKQKPIPFSFVYCPVFLKCLYLCNLLSQDAFASRLMNIPLLFEERFERV